MDWENFSVRRFESGRLDGQGKFQQMATLDALDGGRRIALRLGDVVRDTVALPHRPWHSYDFDFASLQLVRPHLRRPGRAFDVAIADVVQKEGRVTFAHKGDVRIEPAGEVVIDGRRCRKYAIDGPGLDRRGGWIALARDGAYLVEYQIALPDEPGFDSGRMRLTGVAEMTMGEWEEFKSRRK
jgi:hypothetical protein